MAAVIWELIDKGTLLGQQALIRYNFVDPTGVADPLVMIADYKTDVLPVIVAFQSPDYLHTSLIYKTVYPTLGLQQESPITSGGAGTNAGTSLPGSVTFSVKWVIGATVHLGSDSGPHIKRGGKHLGGLTEASVVGNVFTSPSAWATNAANYWSSFTGLSSDSFELAVCHQPPPIAHVGQPVSRYAFVTSAVSQGVGTQVSRKPRHGT